MNDNFFELLKLSKKINIYKYRIIYVYLFRKKRIYSHSKIFLLLSLTRQIRQKNKKRLIEKDLI